MASEPRFDTLHKLDKGMPIVPDSAWDNDQCRTVSIKELVDLLNGSHNSHRWMAAALTDVLDGGKADAHANSLAPDQYELVERVETLVASAMQPEARPDGE